MEMSFPAIRGRQGNRSYYVAMFPLGVIPRLFAFRDYAELPPEQRSQRVINAKRVPEIAKYILENEDGWVFSSLTASFDAEEKFISSELDPNIGVLKLPLGVEFSINDGQHRRAAIEEAVKENKALEKETISVVLFSREGIERDQQIFSDLNRTVSKTSRSLDILYDHRDPMNSIALEVGERVRVFRGRVEKDRVSLAARSARFVTLSSLYDANVQLLGKLDDSVGEDVQNQRVALAVEFWEAVTDNIPEWSAVVRNELSPSQVRAETITSTAVVLWALGTAGHTLVEQYPSDWKSRLAGLGTIDWRKTSPEWQGIAMLGGDVITRRQTREATTDFVKWKLGLRIEAPKPVLSPSVPAQVATTVVPVMVRMDVAAI
jgi:DNA sulfur modification protein DndB